MGIRTKAAFRLRIAAVEAFRAAATIYAGTAALILPPLAVVGGVNITTAAALLVAVGLWIFGGAALALLFLGLLELLSLPIRLLYPAGAGTGNARSIWDRELDPPPSFTKGAG